LNTEERRKINRIIHYREWKKKEPQNQFIVGSRALVDYDDDSRTNWIVWLKSSCRL
jgi:hypothetical protein